MDNRSVEFFLILMTVRSNFNFLNIIYTLLL